MKLFGADWHFWRSRYDTRGLVHERYSVNDAHGLRSFALEVHAPGLDCRISVHAEGRGSEQALSLSLGVPLLGTVYLNLDTPSLRRLADRLIALTPSDIGGKYSGRALRIAIYDCALHWQLWVDDTGWSSRRPKWRDGAWYPIGLYKQRGEGKVIDQREVLVPMPERPYRAKGTLERVAVGFSKLPPWFDRYCTRANIEMLEGEQIPEPGKGENSWDCDTDHCHSLSTPASTLEEGVGAVVASVLRTRRTRGGPAAWPAPPLVDPGAPTPVSA